MALSHFEGGPVKKTNLYLLHILDLAERGRVELRRGNLFHKAAIAENEDEYRVAMNEECREYKHMCGRGVDQFEEHLKGGMGG